MEDLTLWIGENLPAGVRWAPFAAFLFTAVVAVFPAPAEVPAALNGALFGMVWGTALTWAGALTGAWLSFETARLLGRPLAERALPGGLADRAHRLVRGRASAHGLLALRLLPVVAFTLVNWGSGLARVPRRTFLWTTAVGILPGAILFTGAGTAAADLWAEIPSAGSVLALDTIASILASVPSVAE